MKKYLVRLKIRCTQDVVVKAFNSDEARSLAESGEGEQEEMDFGDAEATFVEEIK